MKKNLVFVAIIGLAMTAICGCSSNGSNGNKSITDVDGKKYASYQEACRDGNFEAALVFVDELEEKAMDFEYQQYSQQAVSAYITARDYVFNSEMQYLLANGSKEASDRVLFLLNSLPIKGRRLEEGYKGTSIKTEIVDGGIGFNRDFAWYCESVNSYNEKCQRIMELCISQGNKYLADKVVRLVKETPTTSKIKEYSAESIVHYTDQAKVTIQKMYDEAVASGAFNE